MANTKKYVSLDKLGLYDEKIKKYLTDADAAALKSAKDYADGLAGNYDAAGAAATALTDAKAYADGKDAAIQAAQKAADDAAAAAGVADGKAVAAQGEVDALEAYVGTFTPSEGVDTVVKYIDAKTANIASDATVSALADRVTQAEKDIDAIEADYLKAADKTELEGKITDVEGALDDEFARADAAEKANAAAIKAISDDYLKASDKTELSDAITAEANRAKGIEGGLETRLKAVEDDYLKAADKDALQTQINTIMNNPDAEGAINSINEFTQYVKDHGTIAEGFRTDIDKNKEDIAANAKAITDHATLAGQTYATKTELANEKKALQDEIDADVKVVADDLADLSGVVTGLGNTKADKTALDEAVEALEGADTGLGNRITALENKFGGADGSVEDQIADAKQGAIDAAAADATSKANAAESAAKTYADGLNTDMDARVDALEAIDHDHANKAELDLIASGDKAKWDGAAAIAHEHGNKTVIDGITADNITTWNTVTSKAAQADLTAVSDRVTVLETWHTNFTEVSEEEINALFA
jgi:predicted  nucleic acid-binding Zn-ribbon protein